MKGDKLYFWFAPKRLLYRLAGCFCRLLLFEAGVFQMIRWLISLSLCLCLCLSVSVFLSVCLPVCLSVSPVISHSHLCYFCVNFVSFKVCL